MQVYAMPPNEMSAFRLHCRPRCFRAKATLQSFISRAAAGQPAYTTSGIITVGKVPGPEDVESREQPYVRVAFH
nr:hypothetical protein CFP56_23968 [Quercus suber]